MQGPENVATPKLHRDPRLEPARQIINDFVNKAAGLAAGLDAACRYDVQCRPKSDGSGGNQLLNYEQFLKGGRE